MRCNVLFLLALLLLPLCVSADTLDDIRAEMRAFDRAQTDAERQTALANINRLIYRQVDEISQKHGGNPFKLATGLEFDAELKEWIQQFDALLLPWLSSHLQDIAAYGLEGDPDFVRPPTLAWYFRLLSYIEGDQTKYGVAPGTERASELLTRAIKIAADSCARRDNPEYCIKRLLQIAEYLTISRERYQEIKKILEEYLPPAQELPQEVPREERQTEDGSSNGDSRRYSDATAGRAFAFFQEPASPATNVLLVSGIIAILLVVGAVLLRLK